MRERTQAGLWVVRVDLVQNTPTDVAKMPLLRRVQGVKAVDVVHIAKRNHRG